MGKQAKAVRPNHPEGHCYHQYAPVYRLQLGGSPPVPAIPEICCWCPGPRLTIMAPKPAEAGNHGPSLRFVEPPRAQAEPPRLIVPNAPRLVH